MSTVAAAPCQVHINLSAIRHNLRLLGDPRRVMPVVKSDAYGHGLLPVAGALDAEGVTHFAVSNVGEAHRLRQAGFRQTLVALMGAPTREEMALAAEEHILPLAHSFASLDRAAAMGTPERPAEVAIKCETGMSRLGFEPDELPALLEKLRATPGIRPMLALSHLACADMPEEDAYTRAQARVFAEMTATLSEAFPHLRRSLTNSAGSLAYPELRYDLMRPGLALYGCNPFHGTVLRQLGIALKPAMSVSATVLQVRDVRPGQSVSYGRTFTAARAARIAVLGVGYADGYSRGLSDRGLVTIAGHRAPVRGRVCMGMIMAEVTDIPAAVREGDTAWLLGGPGAQALTAQDVADIWGTIPYEVLCLLGRNTRRY